MPCESRARKRKKRSSAIVTTWLLALGRERCWNALRKQSKEEKEEKQCNSNHLATGVGEREEGAEMPRESRARKIKKRSRGEMKSKWRLAK
jgi:hypothetical protein